MHFCVLHIKREPRGFSLPQVIHLDWASNENDRQPVFARRGSRDSSGYDCQLSPEITQQQISVKKNQKVPMSKPETLYSFLFGVDALY